MIQWRLWEAWPVADGIKEVASGVLETDSRRNKEKKKNGAKFCG
jgi:hypothetical protein